MPTIAHLASHLRTGSSPRSPLFIAAGMVFFFVLFDGILSYLVPIVITSHGFSASEMGFIVAFSSFTGMLFDFVLCRFVTDTHYRRMFFWMFILGAAFPLFLLYGQSLVPYLMAMAMWGFYYDFYSIGSLDFVSRTTPREHHVSSFGILRVFDGFGYLLAPLLASIILASSVSGTSTALSSLLWLFFAIAIVFYITLLTVKKDISPVPLHYKPLPRLSTLAEFSLWKRIGKVIAPVLIFTLIINIVDATFWTIGPLISESLSKGTSTFNGGLFMIAYTLPPLFIGWFIETFTTKYGKRYTAFFALGSGSISLMTLPLFTEPLIIIGICLVSATCFAFTWPAINGLYADYVEDSLDIEREISTLRDAATNLGFVIGPILAGVIADSLGYTVTFSILGLTGAAIATILALFTSSTIDNSDILRPTKIETPGPLSEV